MSTFDYDVLCEQTPSAIEAMEAIHISKFQLTVEGCAEAAKATEAPQFIKDAETLQHIYEVNAGYIKKICGQEGDKGTDTGSMWGLYTVAKQMRTAVGGE